ncbi:MAG: ATP-binding protein [Flavobacteriaceae bacterium]|nr:ATP-binding protein [Flavobacteriaceae bacterium]
MIERILQKDINQRLKSGKAIVVIGPRQVGKTTLIKKILDKKDYLFFSGDELESHAKLSNLSIEKLKYVIGNYKIIFVDEAQRIKNIGLTLKMVTDHYKEVMLIVGGSSAFEIKDSINEPLTGRKWEYELFPISWFELEKTYGFIKSEQQLEYRLLYGNYPEVINNPGDEKRVLQMLINSYLFKDVLSLYGIRKPDVMIHLVRALALQIGSEVSFNELSQILETDKKTISNYIHILEKGYIIFRLSSFSRNIRNEIKFNQKVYFYDTGIRNAILGNFTFLNSRNDLGELWENFLISERLKKNKYEFSFANSYFWRNVSKQEIHYVEEVDGKITGYEIKWRPNSKTRIPKIFKERYDAEVEIIHRENFRDFLM